MANGKPRIKSRSLRQIRRQQGKKTPRKCILIVCEGLKTEPNYFNALRQELNLSLVEVQIEKASGMHITVVNRAITEQEKRKKTVKKAQKKGYLSQPIFDEIWCVFDMEGITTNKKPFYKAIDKANSHNLYLAVSNPAFEYWYLLHFEMTTRPFVNAKDVISALKMHLPNYEKGGNVFEKIFNKTDMAINKAKRALKNHPDKHNQFPNPSTGVFKLVETLKMGF